MLLNDRGRGTRTFLGEGRWRVAREGQGKQRTAEHPYMWCSQTTHFTQISAPEGLCVQSPELIRDLTPQQGCLHVYRWVGWVDVWVMWPSMRTQGCSDHTPEGPVGITINIQPPPTALPLYEPRKVIYRLCWLLSYQPEYASWTPKVPNNTPKLRVLSPSGQLIPGKRQSDQTHSFHKEEDG